MPKALLRTFWLALILLNVAVLAMYALWTSADNWATTRSELHGYDPSQLLPNGSLFWVVANLSIALLIFCDIVVAVGYRAATRAAISPTR
jgi:hypothetical protein